ncbi:hypothetical protein M422DRAFT_28503 [Sphaerobolus stellatus SS14]|uniref:Uncharacterized protein n=1 Tax=Sphaerobolus stellatus (strain SS14) TaxID=990650 RepID=A0A0C9W4S3_SPHS4|nr:hypothetical protein M422DRAFT_28503 [Sphaerobolus stellatus SS14]
MGSGGWGSERNATRETWEGSPGEWDGGESLSFSFNLAAGEPIRLRTPVAANHTPPAQP